MEEIKIYKAESEARNTILYYIQQEIGFAQKSIESYEISETDYREEIEKLNLEIKALKKIAKEIMK